MARPRKEGMDYFPHDTDAANDKKIKALRMLYGNDGYTFYFILLEMIYREPTFELDVSDAETIQILSKECGINEELFNQILQTAIKRDCFDKDAYHERGVLTSNGIKKRATVVVEKRHKMRKRYEDKVSDAETPEEMPQSKVKVKQSNKEIYIAQFELFWDLYPNKKGKSNAVKKWLSYGDSIEIDNVIEGTKRYIQFCKVTERPFKDGSTFVNQKSWEDDWTIPNKVRQLPIKQPADNSYQKHLMDLQRRYEDANDEPSLFPQSS